MLFPTHFHLLVLELPPYLVPLHVTLSPLQFLSNLRSAGLESKAQMFEGVLRVTLY